MFAAVFAGLNFESMLLLGWLLTPLLATRLLCRAAFADAFAGFHDEAIWLIVAAFFFARGFEKTGLGERVANIFVRLFGRSTLVSI